MVNGRSCLPNQSNSCFEGGPVCIYIYNLVFFVLYSIYESRMIIDGRSWFRHNSRVLYT
jgi:hypothetical protein